MQNRPHDVTEGEPPRHNTPADLALGFLTGGVIGVSLTAFISGCIVERAPLIVMGLVLPAVYGSLFFLSTLSRRARAAAVVPRTAVAVIESLAAAVDRTGGGGRMGWDEFLVLWCAVWVRRRWSGTAWRWPG